MKKFLKFVAGVAAVAGAACGVVYCLKKFCGIDLSDDDEESDEENETSDDDKSGDREYVTLDMEGEEASEKEDSEEEKAED